MRRARFEVLTPVSEQASIGHASDGAAIVTGIILYNAYNLRVISSDESRPENEQQDAFPLEFTAFFLTLCTEGRKG
jgi:hypothetical protein